MYIWRSKTIYYLSKITFVFLAKHLEGMNTTDSAGNKTHIDYSRTALRVTFGVIALLAVLGNGLVCAVILRCRRMLKNSYNLMILFLAFTDMFTGKMHVIKIKLN